MFVEMSDLPLWDELAGLRAVLLRVKWRIGGEGEDGRCLRWGLLNNYEYSIHRREK